MRMRRLGKRSRKHHLVIQLLTYTYLHGANLFQV
jgi:hypothetical protein